MGQTDTTLCWMEVLMPTLKQGGFPWTWLSHGPELDAFCVHSHVMDGHPPNVQFLCWN